MTSILDTAAVGRKDDAEDTKTILGAYVATRPTMAQNHTLGVAAEKKPKGTDAGDHLIDPR